MKTETTVLIDNLGNRVGGIARPENSPVIFVKGALPDEQVTINNMRVKKNFIEADLVSIQLPSPDRKEPFCKYFGNCGGCSLQHLSYDQQLKWKKIWVEKAIQNLPTPKVASTVPSPSTDGYRNKVTFDVINNRLTLHAFKGNPVPVESCPLMNESSKKALSDFLKTGIPSGITRISVRGADFTDNAIIELTGDYQDKAPVNWPPAVIRKKGTWFPVKPGNMFEKLGEFIFQVPHGGFFQVNTKAAEKMVNLVLGYVPVDEKTVLDLYGGVGTFGIPLAARGSKVTLVEMNEDACIGCRIAIELNQIKAGKLNTINTKDSSFLTKALKKKKHFETIITDPPRAGMGITISKQVMQLNPSRIIYVSCNPFSAARDIAIFTEKNYTITKITPLDMFPHTDHVETIFLLERGK